MTYEEFINSKVQIAPKTGFDVADEEICTNLKPCLLYTSIHILYEVLEELHQKKHLTILMVSHDLEGVRRYATHILRLHEDHNFFGSLTEYEQEEQKNGRIF